MTLINKSTTKTSLVSRLCQLPGLLFNYSLVSRLYPHTQTKCNEKRGKAWDLSTRAWHQMTFRWTGFTHCWILRLWLAWGRVVVNPVHLNVIWCHARVEGSQALPRFSLRLVWVRGLTTIVTRQKKTFQQTVKGCRDHYAKNAFKQGVGLAVYNKGRDDCI